MRIAGLVADVALELTTLEGLTYLAAGAPAPLGDVRSYGASLGTIPDYTGSPDNDPACGWPACAPGDLPIGQACSAATGSSN